MRVPGYSPTSIARFRRELAGRLRVAALAAGLDDRALCRAARIGPGALAMALEGRRAIGADTLWLAARVSGRPIEWFFADLTLPNPNEAVLTGSEPQRESVEIAELCALLTPESRAAVASLARHLGTIERQRETRAERRARKRGVAL